ncbi:MAG: SDR family NAD(P)-dependent oxidoreductase [bacterium]|nr:SDR family NAD(P)-dependent oxidoreductase [bacterium]
MLETLNRYIHGYVTIPTIAACKRGGLFSLLERSRPLSFDELTQRLNANSGHLRAAIRMLRSLDWLDVDSQNRLSLAIRGREWLELPDNAAELLEFPFAEYFRGEFNLELGGWSKRCRDRWGVSSPLTADLLDGLLLLPCLMHLHAAGVISDTETSVCLNSFSPRVQAEIADLFDIKQWGAVRDSVIELTPLGRFIVERSPISATALSYRPMLMRMSDLLFGDAQSVFERDSDGHETHVDRTLNVVGSGFQHEKFFSDVDEIVEAIFNRLPLEEQPDYVADMGSGDGSLLKRVYQVIRDRTRRGRELASRPVTMIGIDFNERALAATAKTLRGIPHLTVKGDIGAPRELLDDLKALGVSDPAAVLHIRSFLDHDRPYIEPLRAGEAEERRRIPTEGVYVAPSGDEIPAPVMIQSLVEHFERWSEITERHGLVLLEVHSLDPRTVFDYLDHCENLHFDAYHAFSRQYLVESHVFLTSLAEAGLFPRREYIKRYPRAFPFTRITLNWLESKPWRIRQARLADLPALLQLETRCWAAPLRVDENELRRRLNRYPEGQFVIETGGVVAGAVYTQRIADPAKLDGITFHQALDLHDDDGRTLQLLGMNVLPEMQDKGFGDRLLEFVMTWHVLHPGLERLVGVTRCRDYVSSGAETMEEYIRRKNPDGLPVDPILRFHASHGAALVKPLSGYRPEDADNDGFGVLIEYGAESLPCSMVSTSVTRNAASGSHQTPRESVETCIQSLLGARGKSGYGFQRSLREMGLDSLDLMELKFMLGKSMGAELESSFFFEYGTPEAIARYFTETRSAPKNETAQLALNTLSLLNKTAAPDEEEDRESVSNDPIAVIGMAFRFPGGAVDDESFWSLLAEGRDAVTRVPDSRWNLADYGVDPASVPGIEFAGLLDRVDEFDPGFFQISPREAESMDPQQRLLMEVSWHALEDAGIDPRTLTGSATGVFTGVFSHDYETLQVKASEEEFLHAYFGTGSSTSVSAGRLSYFYDLRGPSLAVNTACSSSLTAVHLACQNLRRRECELALAAGVNLLLSPELSIAFARAGMLSPDGRCKTFDRAANGYVRGEGCAVVVLKRLSAALKQGDRVLAVIRGSAINQDGRSNGLTAPNPAAQMEVIRQAMHDAGVSPDQVSYLEAHGTGTFLGDPVEMKALSGVFAENRPQDRPLTLGSVKTNLGHLEAAAGLAGLVKTILALRHRMIPPHIHFTEMNPEIALNGLPVRISARLQDWSAAPGETRIAGVSSFGFSGTNAHVVLEEAPPSSMKEAIARPIHLFPVSAQTEPALRELIDRYARFAGSDSVPLIGDLCASAGVGRAHFERRRAAAVSTLDELGAVLREWSDEAHVDPDDLCDNAVEPKVAFLFTGQGAQFPGMGRSLYETSPVFQQTLNRCADVLKPILNHSLLDILFSDESQNLIHQTQYTQPALFALEYALASLWRSWGVKPAAALGHSVGELAAACLADVFSLEDGLQLIAERAHLMQSMPESGAMSAALTDAQTVETVIEPFGGEVAVAAYNGSRNVVISGPVESIERAETEFQRKNVRTVRLRVSHAFHSPMMKPAAESFERFARTVNHNPTRFPIASNRDGRIAETFDASYWAGHILNPVRFTDGVRTLFERGIRFFLEIGPRPVLIQMARDGGRDSSNSVWLASLAPGESDWLSMLRAAGELYRRGAELDWAALNGPYGTRTVTLPRYPFQHKRYWFNTRDSKRVASIGIRPANEHPLLGKKLQTPLDAALYENSLSVETVSWLADHRVSERIVSPAAASLETAFAAARREFQTDSVVLEDACFTQPVFIPDDAPVRMQCVVSLSSDTARTVTLYSAEGDEEPQWNRHFEARALFADMEEYPDSVQFEEIRRRVVQSAQANDLYLVWRPHGIEHGPAFRAIQRVWTADSEALVELTLPASSDCGGVYGVHPVLLDACLQASAAINPGGGASRSCLPARVRRACFIRPVFSSAWGSVKRKETNGAAGEWSIDAFLFDEEGRLAVWLEDLVFKPVSKSITGKENWRDWLYHVDWIPAGASCASREVEWSPEYDRLIKHELLQAARSESLSRFAIFHHCLETLSLRLIYDALRVLAERAAPGVSLTRESLIDQLGVAPAFHRLVETWIPVLIEHKLLIERDSHLKLAPAMDDGGAAARIDEVRREFPEGEAELGLVERCGLNLLDVLAGRQDPLHLLFPQGDTSSVSRLYQTSPAFSYMNETLGRAASAAWSARSEGAALRVLEIGAGTGSATAHLLLRLAEPGTEYVFTDVSPWFLSYAKDRFKEYNFVEYRTLDVEKLPADQGYNPHAFDVVIAANVLHATARLEETLAHVRELLKPGGILLLLEVGAPQRWIDITFGLTEGWWRFADAPLRTETPLLSPDRWNEVLTRVGFEECGCFVPPGVDPAALHQQHVVYARNPRSISTDADHDARWLILTGNNEAASDLIRFIEARGERCGLLSMHDAGFSSDLRMYLSSDNPLHGVIDLRGLEADEGSLDDAAARLLELFQSMPVGDAGPSIYIVTQGAQAVDDSLDLISAPQAMLWGMARTLRLERPGARCVCVDLDPHDENALEALASELRESDGEDHVAYRKGMRFTARLTPGTVPADLATPETPFNLTVGHRGDLDSLTLTPRRHNEPGEGEVEIEIVTAGLNFRDVLNALDLYPGEPAPLGVECAGVIKRVGPGVSRLQPGDTVSAFATNCFADSIVVHKTLVTRIPAGWSQTEAASAPVAFLTAEYALLELAALQPGERVLIHAAAGGVGQAACQIARNAGAEIYATAHPSKWSFLREQGIARIFNSRDLSFADDIRLAIGGDGIDVVLNSLSGDGAIKSASLLKPNGRFIELGKNNSLNEAGFHNIHPTARYFTVDLLRLREDNPAYIQTLLQRITERCERGEYAPLPHRVYPITNARRAFRAMQQGRHVGKIVFDLSTTHKKDETGRFSSVGSYLITGGWGGLGIATARWMIEHGARRFILMGRSEPNEAANMAIQQWRDLGVEVTLERADVSDVNELRAVIQRADGRNQPVRGVIHAAGVLDDGLIEDLSPSRMSAVLAAKARGALNLHRLTETRALGVFILYSSVASMLGSAGQANHAAANAVLDAVALHRRQRGLPALSICWGAWSEIGAASSADALARLGQKGLSGMPPEACLSTLDHLLQNHEPLAGVFEMDWRRFLRHEYSSTYFSRVNLPSDNASESKIASDATRRAPLAPQSRSAMMAVVREQVAAVLNLESPDSIPAKKGFFELGMDSLTSVELRNRLQSLWRCTLASTVAFDYPNVEALAAHLSETLSTREPTVDPAEHKAVAPAQTIVTIPAIEKEGVEPIAIIGMGCRFPGGADSPAAFWELLKEGRDAVTETPADRWDVDAFYDPDPDAPGKMYSRHGGYVGRLKEFDAEFFGVTPREARGMDPQHRLLLEVCWEALENAAVSPDRLEGSTAGVFMGLSSADYAQLILQRGRGALDAYFATGNTHSMAVGRISYLLGLHGPNLAIDTACSSSLAAVHFACQNLRAQECEIALAGGVNRILTPDFNINFCKARMLSRTGRCRTFDDAADGFVRGEGCGVVVLKRLSDAMADGDRVWAVIRGSAVGQDGRTTGPTAPNGVAQRKVIQRALKQAGLVPAAVDYVEAHGTGTTLGDPIELGALGEVYREDRPADRPLLVGSVKTNIGHLEAAAGVAGLIKTVLALRYGEIPRHLHFAQPNSHVAWNELPVRVVDRSEEWRTDERPRVAGVSSFGFSGTNAHVVLQEAPPASRNHTQSDPGVYLLVLSARSNEALRNLASNYASFFHEHPDVSAGTVCYTAQTGRAHFEKRLAVIACNAAEFNSHLREWLSKGCADGCYQGELRRGADSSAGVASIPKLVKTRNSGGEWISVLKEAARLYTSGCNVDWNEFNRGFQYEKIEIPTYPFQRRTYWLDPEAVAPLTSIQSSPNQPDEPGDIDDWFYEEQWDKLEKPLPASHNPIPFDCLESLQQDGISNPRSSSGDEKALSELEELSTRYIIRAMQTIIEAESSHLIAKTPDSRWGVLPEYEILFGRFAEILLEDGVWDTNDHACRAVRVERQSCDEFAEAFLRRHPGWTEELRLVRRCGERLADVLRGEADPLPLLFPEGDVSSQRIYENSTAALAANARLAEAVNSIVRSLGESSRLRVFEAGAGTGGSTACLAPILSGHCEEYCFTDLSPVFLDNARRRFARYEFFSYRLFDLEKIPAAQGLNEGHYDLVIAANAVHATRDVRRSLDGLKRLLAPGGVLILLEVIQPQRWLDVTFGLIDGWRRFNDFRVGASHPLLSVSQWRQCLTQTGFSETVALEAGAGETPSLRQAVIFSQAPVRSASPGVWVVFTDSSNVSDAIVDELRRRKLNAVTVRPGGSFQCVSSDEFLLRTDCISDYSLLWNALSKYDSICAVNALPLSHSKQNEDMDHSLVDDANASLIASMRLLQSMRELPNTTESRVWIITAGAISLPQDREFSLRSAPLWGFGRAAALEDCVHWGGMIDLPMEKMDESVSSLIDCLLSPGDDRQIALRDGACFAPRLRRMRVERRNGDHQLKPDGWTLITGGFGHLGSALARRLVQNGARRLLLVGRRGAVTPESRALLDELRNQGATLQEWKADVSQPECVNEMLEWIQTSGVPLTAVYHAAGAGAAKPLHELNNDDVRLEMRSKAAAAWLLHQKTMDSPLRTFVCFSSASAAWGAAGQTHYAAANRFLDVLCRLRASQNRSALSVNWGLWRGGGMVGGEYQTWLEKIGMKPMPLQAGLNALDRLEQANAVNAIVADMDWYRFREVYEPRGGRSYLSGLDVKSESTTSTDERPRDRAEAASSVKKPSRVEDWLVALQAEFARLIESPDPARIDPYRGFFDLGMDSLMAVEFKNRLQSRFQVQLPATLAFDYPDIASLAEFMHSMNAPGEETAAPMEPRNGKQHETPAPTGDVEDSIAEGLAKLTQLLGESE